MNIIFLTVSRIKEIKSRGIYTDLMRKFRDEGHNVYIVTPYERQFALPTSLSEVDGIHLLGVRTLNIQKTNIIEKGIGTILLETQFNRAIKKYLSHVNFDLILYSTPPITFTDVVRNLKKGTSSAISYLLLKDIFPQNAVDLGMFSKNSLIYWYFRQKEIGLYKHADYIGCMSPANVEYVLKHNRFVNSNKVEVCPNSIELKKDNEYLIDRKTLLTKLNIPTNKLLFIYGGNLGRPQGVDFLMDVIEANEARDDTYFIIVGNGTEYGRISQFFEINSPRNSSLLSSLPKEEYDNLVKVCDVGLIFLDRRFTIPNYPSRLLSYLENGMPVLFATDLNTDIGRIAETNGYGMWTESGDLHRFMKLVDNLVSDKDLMKIMGKNAYSYLCANYTVQNSYRIIMKHFE